MGTFPIPVLSLERYYKINGETLEKNYKEHLSGFREWNQLEHANDWVLIEENMGEQLSIDESMHAKDLFTFLSNKKGHGKKGTLIVAVRGTKALEVIAILMNISEEKRLAVKEVTMDYSDSMYSIVTQVFPNASIVIDCFHVMKDQCEALDCIRVCGSNARQSLSRTRKRRNSTARRRTARRQESDIVRPLSFYLFRCTRIFG